MRAVQLAVLRSRQSHSIASFKSIIIGYGDMIESRDNGRQCSWATNLLSR